MNNHFHHHHHHAMHLNQMRQHAMQHAQNQAMNETHQAQALAGKATSAKQTTTIDTKSNAAFAIRLNEELSLVRQLAGKLGILFGIKRS